MCSEVNDNVTKLVKYSNGDAFDGTIDVPAKLESTIDTGFEIYKVIFKSGDTGNPVFDITKDYYVLKSTNAYAMGFDYNGGTYYMNLTIDDGNLSKDAAGDLNAEINLYDKMTIYYVDGSNKFTNLKQLKRTKSKGFTPCFLF